MLLIPCRITGSLLAAALILPGLGYASQEAVAPAVQPQHALHQPLPMHLSAPITRWDEALPLGNGMLGGLLWGEGNTIQLSLDRGDLWDERLPKILKQEDWNYATLRQLQAEGNQAELNRLFDNPYNELTPTKLPGGRLVIHLPDGTLAQSFTLDLENAEGEVQLGDRVLRSFFSATEPVAMMRIPGQGVELEILRPKGLDKLGYAAGVFGSDGELIWMHQVAASGLEYTIVVGQREHEQRTELAIAIASTHDGADPLTIARQRVESALEWGYSKLEVDHRSWWRDFWNISAVQIPDQDLQKHYDLVKYFYGAASRRGAPPMPLQGVWTRDDGGLPPWKGDFHNDLNTQMTYLACHAAGLHEAGLSFLDYQWQLLPQYRNFAKSFFGVQGAAVPGVATLQGQALGGWAQYSLSPVQGFWVGHSFYLHWRYTQDDEFLKQRAYPWMKEIGTAIADLFEESNGRLFLPLSSSPEIHNNSLRAWLKPNSNYDLDLMRWGYSVLAQMADVLHESGDATRWRHILSKLEKPHVDENLVRMFASDEPFKESHRHHSHLMAIHPLGLLHPTQSRFASKVVEATLDKVNELGTQAWVGYSFSWYSCMLARVGRAEEALRYLKDYERAFTLRNGFHANGDQIGAGLSGFRYRPFTLEGNFLAMQAVHEMLLQSWDEWIRIFPTVSREWQTLSFTDLRAEGGFLISAKRKQGQTTWVRITATVPGLVRLKDPFNQLPAESNIPIEKSGLDYFCHLGAGQSLILEIRP